MFNSIATDNYNGNSVTILAVSTFLWLNLCFDWTQKNQKRKSSRLNYVRVLCVFISAFKFSRSTYVSLLLTWIYKKCRRIGGRKIHLSTAASDLHPSFRIKRPSVPDSWLKHRSSNILQPAAAKFHSGSLGRIGKKRERRQRWVDTWKAARRWTASRLSSAWQLL